MSTNEASDLALEYMQEFDILKTLTFVCFTGYFMVIQWYGNACFRVQGAQTDATLVVDPFDPSLGIKLPKLQSDILLISSHDEAHTSADFIARSTDAFFIDHPGEYERKGVFIRGVGIDQKGKNDTQEHVTIFSCVIDDVFVGHLGGLSRTLSEAELDLLGKIDILCVPVGGEGVLTPSQAVEVIAEIEPRIIVPMSYALPGIKRSYTPLDTFLKEYGVKEHDRLDKLKILKKDLPVEETKVIELNCT